MITEDYCSYEVAKLLKEKRFNEGCSFVVNAISKSVIPVSWPTTNSDVEDEKASLIALPTHQMAMKWLREKGHNIILTMLPKDDDCFVLWTFNICSNKNYKIMWGTKQPKYNSYEEAVEAALKYVLENSI